MTIFEDGRQRQKTKVQWGIIGVGDVCEVKSAPAMNLIAHSKIVAVMRRNGDKAKDYACRHGIERWYDDADELLADPNVNAIYIATPPYAHCDFVVRAAKAGKPIYVEKPMANTYAQCQSMLKACEQNKVPLWVAYYRRALPHFLKVKALLEQGVIGDVRQVEVRMCKPLQTDVIAASDEPWRTNPALSRGGYFADLASHQLDALDFLLGPIATASGHGGNLAGAYSAEDIVTAQFVFESGVQGTGSWCFSAHAISDRDETIITGSKGEIVFPSFGDAELTVRSESLNQHFTFETPKHIQHDLIQQVVAQLRGEGECVSTGESAARTNFIMDCILGDVPS